MPFYVPYVDVRDSTRPFPRGGAGEQAVRDRGAEFCGRRCVRGRGGGGGRVRLWEQELGAGPGAPSAAGGHVVCGVRRGGCGDRRGGRGTRMVRDGRAARRSVLGRPSAPGAPTRYWRRFLRVNTLDRRWRHCPRLLR